MNKEGDIEEMDLRGKSTGVTELKQHNSLSWGWGTGVYDEEMTSLCKPFHLLSNVTIQGQFWGSLHLAEIPTQCTMSSVHM